MQFFKTIMITSISVMVLKTVSAQQTKDVLSEVDAVMENKDFKQQVSNPFGMKQDTVSEKYRATDVSQTGYNAQAQGLAEQAKRRIEIEKEKMAQNGDLERFGDTAVQKQIQQHKDAAQLIADESMASLSGTLENQFGMEAGLAQAFSKEQGPESQTLTGIFISFNMGEAAILEAMKAAVRDNSQLYLNGIAKDHGGIQDAIKALQVIGLGLDVKPDVRFQPKKFEAFGITKAPTMIYSTPEKAVLAEGILNMQWLKTKHADEDREGHLGNYGAVYDVTEESIIETIRKRMASFDWEGKKEEAINSFWEKQAFNRMPRATEDDSWFIDPTVKVAKDITNPQGQLLAKAGQVVNPIKSAPAPLTFYAFNPTDINQLQWAHRRVNSDVNNGQVMLMFSEIDNAKGWEHLSTLRKHFGREMFKLPQELINKFDLTALPVRVTTDVQRGVFKVEQFNVGDKQ